MKVPLHLVKARREKIAAWMQQHGHVSLQQICRDFGISEATARRDLAALEKGRHVVRTYGGALAEYNQRFASFQERRQREAGAKAQIAAKALAFLQPEQSVFLDAGSTLYAVAEALLASPIRPLEIITNNLPIAERLAAGEGLRVHLPGGELLPRQSVLAGKAAKAGLSHYRIDTAFLGAEAMDGGGVWNSQADVVAFQQRVIERATNVLFCIDQTKLARTAAVFLGPWDRIDHLLCDAEADLLTAAGIPERLLPSL